MPEAYRVFVYGSLCVREVFARAAGAEPDSMEPATLLGWRRGYVRGVHYPGIIPDSGSRVEGFLVHGVTPEMLDSLDHFEGKEYERRTLPVHLVKRAIQAEVYVIGPGFESLVTSQDWNLEHFRKHELNQFLAGERAVEENPKPRRRLPPSRLGD